MRTEIHLEPGQVPSVFRGRYRGKKFSAVVTDTITLAGTTWGGGSRASYHTLNLKTGETSSNLTEGSSPPEFGKCADGIDVAIPEGWAVVKHSIFRGKDLGLTFYVNPQNASLLLPEESSDSLSDAELCLLDATASLKSSYGGRKPREDMMSSNGFSEEDIAQAKASLIEKKYLRANGAITPAGRNHRPERGRFKSW